MDFKLFGRLRDDEDSGSSSLKGGQSTQSNSGGGSDLSEGGLKRTVKNMSQQGYSEDEIKQELQGQYSVQEIERAMNSAVTQSATSRQQQGSPEPLSQYSSEQDQEAVSPMDQGYEQNNQQQQRGQQQNSQQQQQNSQNRNNNRQQGFQQGGQQSQQQQMQQRQQEIQQQASGGEEEEQLAQGQVDQEVEQLIETIVAENFQRVKTEFENVYEELDAIEDAVEDLENRVHDLEVRDDEDQQEFLEKMDEIEQHIDDYESRIGGLEKAFQQVLPSLVDNVRDLTSLVQEIKQEKGIETDTSVSSDEMDEMDMENW